MKQILITLEYKLVPIHEDLTKTSNETDSFTNIIQIKHFDYDNYTTYEDHFGNTQNDNQVQCDDVDNFEHKSYNELDRSQQMDG